MFRKVLVANRGEIAIRVMRTCREMGIKTVAIYSKADRAAAHTLYADEAYEVGPAPSKESYLHLDRIMDAAKTAGADAIHPGYGFLSERADFAERVHVEGLTFIGPPAEAIRAMGNKTNARKKMQAAGVPVVPGTTEPITSLEDARKAADEIGYPLFLKAAAGGGGRGMRLIKRPDQLETAIERAGREAEAAFGDGAVYIERFIQDPRHIEIQIFGDRQGHIIHLNERECSIQRRHQKVIEEAPSVVVDADLRQRMGAIAVRAGEAVQYEGAGTVEFLVDAENNFYFLEMNTRLQVEHPVTELTTGFDLVKAQLEVAAGHGLPLQEAKPQGHAVEVRIYAENPDKNFRPSPGKITRLQFPEGPGIRVDSGVYAGVEVSPYYDPMIAKIVTYGPSREAALKKMDRALQECIVEGIETNVDFLGRIIRHPEFEAGRIDTHFLQKNKMPAPALRPDEFQAAVITAAIQQFEAGQKQTRALTGTSDHNQSGKWRTLARQESLRGPRQ